MHPENWTVTNYSTGQTTNDKFHSSDQVTQVQCTEKQCKGSMMGTGFAVESRSTEEVLRMAKIFIDEFYDNYKIRDTPEHMVRWEEILAEVASTGTYELTFPELEFGAKLSWRNASRCIGRIQWNKLKVFDGRKLETTRQMFDAICQHIEYATNGGNIRSTISVFAPRRPGKPDFRVWNPQLISYAGYKNEDGSVTGDPGNVAFTKVCMRLGWMGKRTKWDILPLVLSSGGASPDVFDVPEDIVLQVPLVHPSFWWFATLGLRWYALPAVSGMLFDCGGVQFPACPFNGWYMSTEVGCRDLCDPQRYNVVELVATEMGEDTGNEASLWKDRALVEVNVAVLYSYQQQGVTIVDHHTASDNFVQHLETEQRLRKGCPADWVWVVPPMSGSLTSVYHQEMAMYVAKPSYDYQVPAWKTHAWEETRGTPCRFSFKQVAKVVVLCTGLYRRAMNRRMDVTILYATETGKSQVFANKLADIFGHALNPKVVCMDDYDLTNLRKESLVLIVTSTFGNGDAPVNGIKFARKLTSMKSKSVGENGRVSIIEKNNDDINLDILPKPSVDNSKLLKDVRYSVFALGSSAYPNFCAFGHTLDQLFSQLGARKLMEVGEGDELSGQQKSFRKWFSEIYPVACQTFNISVDQSVLETELLAFQTKHTDKTVRFVSARGELLEAALSKATRKNVKGCKLLRRTQLHKVGEYSSTILVELGSEERYLPGDHVGVLPENRTDQVEGLLRRLDAQLDPHKVVALQLLSEKQFGRGSKQTWAPHGSLPACSLRTLLTRFLDITTPLRPAQLDALAGLATLPEHSQRLTELATDTSAYETWRNRRFPTVLEVLQEFPSVRVSPALLATILHPLQPRFYSISSCRDVHPGEIHLTVSVVSFRPDADGAPVHYGVCSNYLNELAVGDHVYLFLRTGKNFGLPLDVSKPVLMVGPGTGIAPFRGFWEQRRHQLSKLNNEQARGEFGEMTLFFGCRDREMDLFHDEKLEMIKEGALHAVFVALSRDPSVPKTYVQHVLAQQGASVYRQLATRGGHLFVCGDVTMAEGVRQALTTIVKQHAFLDDADADAFVNTLKKEKRYHEDIFGVTQHGSQKREVVDFVPVTTKKKQPGLIGRVLCCSGGRGSLTSVYHQEMAMYVAKPSYDYQVPAWKTHAWEETRGTPCRFSFKQVAKVVVLCTGLYRRAMNRRMDVTILYATETGKSQVFANKLADIFGHALNPKVVCMDDYDLTNLRKESLVLIVTSTFGNGDAPVNGIKFARKLTSMKSKSVGENGRVSIIEKNNDDINLDILPKPSVDNSKLLKDVRYSVFALGSSAYPNFCAFGHTLDQLFSQLGARKLMEVGEGDELSGQQKSFRKWFSEIYPVACQTFNISVDQSVLETELLAFQTKHTDKTVRFVSARGELLEAALSKATRKNVKGCKLLRRTQLHKVGEYSSTILVELGSEERYLPGDHVGVLPENRTDQVEGLLRRLDAQLDPHKVVALQLLSEKQFGRGSKQTWAPHGSLPACSLRTLLTRFLDITTPLRPAQLDALAGLATLPEHSQRLTQLATDTSAYETWRNRRFPTVLEVLQEFPSVRVSPALLATILHPLQPRFYSISSCRDVHPGEIHLTVSVVSFRPDADGAPVHYGVCSNYLNELAVGDHVYLFLRTGKNFGLPLDVSKPVLMVGPGTGIAPFRGFWEQRRHQLSKLNNEQARGEFGEMTLFFGCRDREMDLFHDEKLEMIKEGALHAVFVALSRDPSVPKTYVQHVLAQQGASVYRQLATRGGHLFVCGDVTMAEGVRQALTTIVKQHAFLDDADADAFVNTLKKEKRYHEDIFGVTQHGSQKREVVDFVPVTTKKKQPGLIGRVLCCSGGRGNAIQPFPTQVYRHMLIE